MAKQSSGMGLASVLLVIFVVLKLVGTIAWSWFWVLSPLWMGFALFSVFGVIAALVGGTAVGLSALFRKR